MKSFIERFVEENSDTLYCTNCLQPSTLGCFKMCTEPFIAFKDFDPTTQLEIMEEEIRNAYNS